MRISSGRGVKLVSFTKFLPFSRGTNSVLLQTLMNTVSTELSAVETVFRRRTTVRILVVNEPNTAGLYSSFESVHTGINKKSDAITKRIFFPRGGHVVEIRWINEIRGGSVTVVYTANIDWSHSQFSPRVRRNLPTSYSTIRPILEHKWVIDGPPKFLFKI